MGSLIRNNALSQYLSLHLQTSQGNQMHRTLKEGEVTWLATQKLGNSASKYFIDRLSLFEFFQGSESKVRTNTSELMELNNLNVPAARGSLLVNSIYGSKIILLSTKLSLLTGPHHIRFGGSPACLTPRDTSIGNTLLLLLVQKPVTNRFGNTLSADSIEMIAPESAGISRIFCGSPN